LEKKKYKTKCQIDFTDAYEAVFKEVMEYVRKNPIDIKKIGPVSKKQMAMRENTNRHFNIGNNHMFLGNNHMCLFTFEKWTDGWFRRLAVESLGAKTHREQSPPLNALLWVTKEFGIANNKEGLKELWVNDAIVQHYGCIVVAVNDKKLIEELEQRLKDNV